MAKASKRKLKVFRTQIGFHELAVATGSRAAALRAFGARQDLFALGLAAETADAEIVAVTSAQPDVVLKRPVGSDLPFGTEAVRPRIADVDPGGVDPPPETRRAAKAEPAPPAKKGTPKPDRTKLTAAEERLAGLEREEKEAAAEADERLDALRAEERRIRGEIAAAEADGKALRKEWRERLERAVDAVDRERKAFERLGGED